MRVRAALREIAHVAVRLGSVLLGLLSLTAAGLILLLSQTVVGRDLAAGLVEDLLDGAMNGKAEVGPILGGNLLTRVRLAHFEIVTEDGVTFVSLDSVRVEYNAIDFLFGRFRFRNLEIGRMELRLEQNEQGSWNFDRLFGRKPGDWGLARTLGLDEGSDSWLLFSDATVEDGQIVVRTPWAADRTGADRAREIAAGLSGERLWRVRESSPGRYERVIEITGVNAGFPRLRLIAPDRPMRFEIDDLQGLANVVSQPLHIHRFDGSATFRDSIEITVERMDLGSSALTGTGWVEPSTPPVFAFDLVADSLALADLQWLPVPIPSRGGGPVGSLRILSHGEAVVVVARDGDIRIDDSRIAGSFELETGEPTTFRSIDVMLQPLRATLIDEVLDRESLIDGYLRGPFHGSGPVTLLQVDAELELADVTPDTFPSRVAINGGVSVGPPGDMADLAVGMTDFEIRWARVVGLAVDLPGRMSGMATFNGKAGGAFSFDADVRHRMPGASESWLVGGGDLDLKGDSTINLAWMSDPLSLSILDPYVEDVEVVGDVRGPISASGRLSDLQLRADLQTPRGQLSFEGRFDVASEDIGYDAELRASDINLEQWARNGPATTLEIRGAVRGRGQDPATLEATFDLEILPSLFEGAVIDSSLLRFTMSDGLAKADTFAIRTDVGNVDGFGAFGLVEETSGSLILSVEATDMAQWNRWVIAGRNVSRRDTTVESLFEEFAAGLEGDGETVAPVVPDTLSGSITGLGVLYGNLVDYGFGGRLFARGPAFGKYGADSAQVTVDIVDPTTLDSLQMRSSVWMPRIGLDLGADSLFVRWTRHDSIDSNLEVYARRDSTVEIDVAVAIRWSDANRAARVSRLRLKTLGQDLSLVEQSYVSFGDSGLVVRSFDVRGGQGVRFFADGSVPADGDADFKVEVSNIDFGALQRFTRDDEGVSGILSGTAMFRGNAARPEWQASFQVRDPGYFRARYELLETDLSYADRRLDVTSLLQQGARQLARVEGQIGIDLSMTGVERRVLDDPLDLRAIADSMPLDPLELAFESLRDVDGFVVGDVRVSGAPGSLSFRGNARLAGGATTLPDLGIRLQEIGGRLFFEGADALLDSVYFASSEGGSGSIGGRINLSTFSDPQFELDVRASELGAMNRRLATLTIDGSGNLGGSYRTPLLTGGFRLYEGDIRIERFLRQSRAIDLTDPALRGLIDTTLVAEQRLLEQVENPFMRNLRMDVNLTLGPQLWLRSNSLDVEIAGDVIVNMDRQTDSFVASGTLNLDRGKYRFQMGRGQDFASIYSRQLDITGGTISFVGTPGLDPNLDIDAVFETRSDVGPIRITVNISGTSLSPQLRLDSDPPLPESDRYCYLLFSAPCIGMEQQQGNYAIGLARDGILGTVGSQVSSVLVSDVGLVDYLDIRSANTAYNPDSERSLLYGTQIEIGRYIGRDVFVKASQPLGARLPGASIEWRFAAGWAIEVRTEDRFDLSLSSQISNLNTERSYGLFLTKEWIF